MKTSIKSSIKQPRQTGAADKQKMLISGRDIIRYYWRHMWRYRARTIGWLIAVPITIFSGRFLSSLIIATALDRLTRHQFTTATAVSDFGPLVGWYAGALLLSLIGWRVVDFCMWHLEQNISQNIAEEVFDHLQSRSLDFHANHFGGSMVSQTNKLLGGYVRVQDTTIYSVYPMLAGFFMAIAILLPRAPWFTVGLIGFIVIYLTVAFLLAKPINKYLTRFAAAESKQTGLLADAITNASVIKSFANFRYEKRRFHDGTENTKSHLRSFATIQQKQITALGGMDRLIAIFAFIMAIVAVVRFDANIATVFLVLTYANLIGDQLFQFSNNGMRTYNRAIGDAKEMLTILTEEQEIKDPPKPEKLSMRHGEIVFDNITFTHNGARDAIFEGFSAIIKPGEKVGLVGHSGSGKTTFTRLLLRFSDIQRGRIAIDGQDIAAVTQADLHSRIAYVPQEPLLFHRSICENIGYGNLRAEQADIEKAAASAHADEFIRELPSGYDTLVGERGVKLSGGQRQRVAIARAMLKDAPILVLDEATSALDSESEVLIQDALWKLMEGRTAIVIAHRLSTIQRMDRIIVLDAGKIVEEGSHRELLKRGGTYAKLWAHQSGGFIDE